MTDDMDLKTSGHAPAAAPRRNRRAFRLLGNVLLGVAVGLLGYYLVTDVVAGVEQKTLRDRLTQLGPVGTSGQAGDIPVESGPTMDFTGWESQDKAYWDSLGKGGVFGRLIAEKMNLDAAIVKGVAPRNLQRGPGWITTTSLPGPTGNCGISGHRTTYAAPFRWLDRLKPGDTVYLFSPYRRYRYEVVRSFTVRPQQVEVLRPTAEPMLTMTACHPPYSAAYRLIVQSKLVEVRQLSGGPPPVP